MTSDAREFFEGSIAAWELAFEQLRLLLFLLRLGDDNVHGDV